MITQQIAEQTVAIINELYQVDVKSENLTISRTRADFEGDFTLVTFPLAKIAGKSPQDVAQILGQNLVQRMPQIISFNVIKGFLNLSCSEYFWSEFFQEAHSQKQFGFCQVNQDEKPVLIEYSSPNTNKPLHLGHVRNNLLGWSISKILEASGKKVYRVNLVNDRGIHICKSMLAWQKSGLGETPASSGLKGDHLVGKYYVVFDQLHKAEVQKLIEQGLKPEEAAKNTSIILEAQEMLRKWEAGDEDVRELWHKMNSWVYDGFEKTYQRMGVSFHKTYHESDTYLLGKKLVDEGLEKKALFKKDDGSVWIDLTEEGLDEKLLLRADGTSVYITQDLGTAQLRHDDFDASQMVYVVGNEQIYHFDVLKKVLSKIGKDWADAIFHLSYGMVELPDGKMKSREGTVVDADELMDDMVATARQKTEELGKIEDFETEDAQKLYEMIGMAALKYFILKVDPKKTMLFNPQESIDFNGHTGPFIQYTYARIRSIYRKSGLQSTHIKSVPESILPKEKELLRTIYEFPQILQEAAANYSPALIANYIYELAKVFNQFYHEISILREPDEIKRNFRISLSVFCGQIISNAMDLLGIEVPEKM